ncbi:hypothetical protein FH972_025437 [Carpinus fangiana]|uniref:Nephrocystin 3-like N-terminal domain-containing protein n=1 Tax=Carpinus fangiana TaxID=176857 RepID=A0A5N6L3L8_9ROSI|nr:hypothetical protein FH972_025437 [Carpinus fangiana]
MATIMFHEPPHLFDNGKSMWTLPGRSHGLAKNVLVDSAFLDFTVLRDTSTEGPNSFDCVAISGLASHPFGSWRSRHDREYMWLRDQLPDDFPGVRTITYGFENPLTAHESFQTIDDLAASLVLRLRIVGRASPSARPLVFFAHSLGGIVLKRCLLLLASGSDADQEILKSVKAILFFGVPNRGMQINNLLSVLDGGTDDAIIRLLGPDSAYLKMLEQRYGGVAILQRIRLLSFFETKNSPLIEVSASTIPLIFFDAHPTQRTTDGQLKRRSQYCVLVDRDSAVHASSSPRDIVPINHDHSNMVKFSTDDENYQKIASCLYDIFSSSDVCQLSLPSTNILESSPPANALLLSGSTAETKSMPEATFHIPVIWSEIHRSLPTFDATNCTKWLCNEDLSDKQTLTFRFANLARMNHARVGSGITFDARNYREWLNKEQREEDMMIQSQYMEKAWSGYVQRIDHLMIQSLLVSDASYREATIPKAHASTFRWAFENADIGLQTWLKTQKGLFWIQGKPGSGKSTIMKYIWQDETLHKTLGEASNPGITCLKISFFFSDRGTYFQKSFEGLLQSLIHQILKQEPLLATYVEPIFIKRGSTRETAWSLLELEAAFQNIVSQHDVKVHIFLLLDALDEYDGSKEMLCRWVEDMSDRPAQSSVHFSVLFASRPWNIFTDAFEFRPGFKMQDHTGDDIRKYAHRMIQDRPVLHQVLSSPKLGPNVPDYNDVVAQIVAGANGVFLWVSLTLDELLVHASNGIDRSELFKILSGFPPELHDFYRRIISKIPQEYRIETYIMIEVVLRCQETLYVRNFASTVACAQALTFEEYRLLHFESQTTFNTENMQRRIRSRTGGLLEIAGHETVQFMHQSAREFLQRPDFISQLINEEDRLRLGNGNTFMFKNMLAFCCIDWFHGISEEHWSMLLAHENRGPNSRSSRERLHNLFGKLIASKVRVHSDYDWQDVRFAGSRSHEDATDVSEESKNDISLKDPWSNRTVAQGIALIRSKLYQKWRKTGRGSLQVGFHIPFHLGKLRSMYLAAQEHELNIPLYYFLYGRLAEANTGSTNRQFLDSIKKTELGHIFILCGDSAPVENIPHLTCWRLWFAAVAGYELYVRELIEDAKLLTGTGTITLAQEPMNQLLHAIITAKTFPKPGHATITAYMISSGAHKSVKGSFSNEAADPIVLDYGMLHFDYDSRSCIQDLFQKLIARSKPMHDNSEVVKIMLHLLNAGHHPNETIRCPLKNMTGGMGPNRSQNDGPQHHVVCYFLHVACINEVAEEVVKLLLERGAPSNQTDAHGLTPVDWIVKEAFDIDPFAGVGGRERAGYDFLRRNALLMTQRGGFASTKGKRERLDALLSGDDLRMGQQEKRSRPARIGGPR